MNDERIKAILKASEDSFSMGGLGGWRKCIKELVAEIEELNAELKKRKQWMKDNRVWDAYCGGVVPSGPPKPSEGKP